MQGEPEDELEDSPRAIAARHRQTWLMLGGVVGVAALLLAIYHFLTLPPPEPGTGETLSARQMAEAVKPWVARIESFTVSGQAQPAGMAVTVAQGEMMTTCHNLPLSGQMRVVFHDGSSKAQASRLNKAIDVCQLRVATTGPKAAKLRGGDPAAGEKVYVAVMDRAGAPRLVDTRVAKIVQDPNGTAFTLEAKDKFTAGAAVFDTQARLVGLVNRDGNAAWSATRIESARERQRPAS